MAVVVAEGIVELTADASNVPRDVARDIDNNGAPVEAAGRGLGKKVFGGVLAGWAAIGGINAVVGFFTGAVSGASDLNETMSKTKAIFGENTSAIVSWSQNSATNLGLTTNAAMASAAGFGDMFTQIGFTGESATSMAQQVVQAAADLGSFSNLDTADVADRMSAAFRGEYDSLQAVIPNINAARVESEALAMTGKTVTSELTAQEKAAAVLAIVQKDGARAMGDFARTSDGAANSARIVTAQLGDQQAKLGTQLLPIWQGFLGFLSNTAIPIFTDVVTWIGKNSDTLLLLGGVIAGAAVTYYAITTAMGIYKAFQVASAAATGGLTVAQWALNAAMTANPIGIIIVAIAALVAGIIWVATQTTFFQDAWAVMSDVIGAAATWLWETVLQPVFTAIGAIFMWLYENVIMPVVTGIMIYVGLWAAIFTWLWEAAISPIFAAIGAIFKWVYESIIMPIVGYIVLAVKGWGLIFTWLYENIINPVFTAIGAAFNWVWSNVISPVVGFITGAIDTVGSTVSSVFGGIASFIGNAFNAALGVVRGPINGIISLVNGAIRGINTLSVTIPSWVPIVGGQKWGLNIPSIPMLARGSRNAPDTFIAGEAGPELITGGGGSRVYSNAETRDMLSGGRGGDVYIDNVVLDASNVDDFTRVVELIKALPQVARSGRGNNVRTA